MELLVENYYCVGSCIFMNSSAQDYFTEKMIEIFEQIIYSDLNFLNLVKNSIQNNNFFTIYMTCILIEKRNLKEINEKVLLLLNLLTFI